MPRQGLLPVAAVLVLLLPTRAGAQTTEAWEAPTLTITRYDEDWSDLADAVKRAHHWTGPFKYIPLGDAAWASTGMELRARNENITADLWGSAPVPDDSYLWLRALPYADLHLGRFRAFVQPVAAYAVGMPAPVSPVSQTRTDLLQGFAEANVGPVTLRAGRQMLSLGSERLVGTRYGPNVPLAFDGVRGIFRVGTANINVFALNPVAPGPASFDDRTSAAKALWGSYATLTHFGLDLYYLGTRNRQAHYGGVTDREVRHTFGARVFGTREGWHWNFEAAGQVGRFGTRRIAAWTLASEIGHRFAQSPGTPDATVRVNVVSGDTRAGDRTLGTFNALFPKGKYFGELSPVGPTNIVSANPRVSAVLGKGVTASLAGMAYWRYTTGDGIYDIPGNLVRGPGTSGARFIGKEAEATLAWQATAELELSISASAFAPGGFIRATGPAQTITLVGTEANFRF